MTVDILVEYYCHQQGFISGPLHSVLRIIGNLELDAIFFFCSLSTYTKASNREKNILRNRAYIFDPILAGVLKIKI